MMFAVRSCFTVLVSAAIMVSMANADAALSASGDTAAVVDTVGQITTESLTKEEGLTASMMNVSATVTDETTVNEEVAEEEEYDEDEEEYDEDEEEYGDDDEEAEWEAEWAEEGPGTDFGMAQALRPEDVNDTDAFTAEQAQAKFEEIEMYMQEIVMKDEQYEEVREFCINYYALCTIWAAVGECEINSEFMLDECTPACKSCDQIELIDAEDADEQEEEEEMEDQYEDDDEEEDEDEELETEGPGTDFGFLQDVDPSFAHEDATPFTEQNVHDRLKHSAEYMGLVMTDDKFIESREVCWNYFTMCTIWAVTGECEKNPEFMLDECAPACYSCDKIDLNDFEYDVIEEIEQVA